MKKGRIKYLILGFISLITLSTITVSSIVSCSNNSTTSTNKQNQKQDINQDANQDNKLTATKIENILKNKSVCVSGYKSENVKKILDNENSKQTLQQNIKQSIIDKIISSSNNQLSRSEIENNLKIQFSNQSENTTFLNNKGEIPVTVYYDGQSLGIFNVQGFSSYSSSSTQTSPVISFNESQYLLNLQNGASINNFEITPNISNWKQGYQLQYSLNIDGTTINPFAVQNTQQPFSFSQNIFNELVLSNPQYKYAKYLSIKLIATIITSDYNNKVQASTQIIIQNNPLFLYATPSYNTNIQSTNLNCYVNEKYYLNFVQYQNEANGGFQYSLIENTNIANSNSTKTLSNTMNISPNQAQSSIDQISKYAQFGIVTYWLELINPVDSQVIMKSNPLTINCNKQGGISITNPDVNTNTSTLTVNLNKTTSCTLTLNNNVPGVTYNIEDIYYQVAANNNEWEPITNASNLFSATLKNNELILSNLASNIGINIQLKNADTHLYSNIFTINTIAPTSMWTQFTYNGNNETLTPNTSYKNINYNAINIANNQTLNLNFLVPNINLSNVQYGWSILQKTGFVSVGSNQPTFTKSWSLTGVCFLRMQISWPNEINISPLIYIFKIQIGKSSNSSLNNANTELKNFISQQSNLLSVALSYFKLNPSELLAFIDAITNNDSLTLAPNVQMTNCSSYFKVNSCCFNGSNLLQFNLTIINNISIINNNSGSTNNINSGTTVILTTPFQPNSFIAQNSIKTGLTEININIINAIKKLNGNQQIGWELQNCSNGSFNNQFYSINAGTIMPQNNSWTITITNNDSTLPNFLKSKSNYATQAMVWNMLTPDQIEINYSEGGASNIVFDPFIFPNPSSITYNWYVVSGNELNNENITGKSLGTTTNSEYMINISNINSNETFTYYCLCSYEINGKTYTSRSQNILVIFFSNN